MRMSFEFKGVVLAAILVGGIAAGCGGGGAGGTPSGSGQLVTLVTPSIPAGTTGMSYDTQFEASFVHPPGVFQVTGGGLPPGLKLDIETGVLAGYPRQTGHFHFEIGARDGADTALPEGRDANFAEDRKTFDLEVALGPPNILPQIVPTAQYRAGYSYQIEVAGGTKPYTFAKVGGTLPNGLKVGSTGILGSFPTSSGGNPYAFDVQVTDANGLTDTDRLSLDVIVLPLIVLTSSIPEAAVNFPYDVTMQLASTGAGAPISWSQKPVIAGEVLLSSIGMEISADGHLRHAAGPPGPTSVGTFLFTLAVKDEALQEATRQLSLTVNPGPVITSISPNRASSAGPFTITGMNFQAGAQVIFKPGATQTSLATTFVSPTSLTFKAPVPKPSNGSGGVDVMVKNPDTGSYTKANAFVFPATTIAFATKGFLSSNLSSTGLAAADLNGDGRGDIVHCGVSGMTTYSGSGSSTAGGLILHMNAGGSPPTFGSTTLDAGGFYDVKIADVNTDGKPDIVALAATSIKVWLNGISGNPLGTFTAVSPSTLPSGFSWPSEMAIGKINADAIPDIAFGVTHYPVSNLSGRVYTMAGTGTGAFTLLDSAISSISNTYGVISLACVDSDGNGRDEILAGVGMNPYSGPLANHNVPASNGLFGTWVNKGVTTTNPGYGSTTAVITGDFLGNGSPCVLTAMSGSPTYSNARYFAMFSGSGLATQTTLGSPSSFSKCLTSLDADFDAPQDWALSSSPGNILVYKGSTQALVLTIDVSTGSPSVSTPQTGRLASADLDGDGKPDLLATTSYWATEGMASNYGVSYKTNAVGNGGTMGIVFYLNTSN